MNLRYVREWSQTFSISYSERYIREKAILGLALIGLIALASLQAENYSCGWLHYATGELTVARAAASMNVAFLLNTAVSSTTSGFMFCDWWDAMFALQQEQIIYVDTTTHRFWKRLHEGLDHMLKLSRLFMAV